MEAKLRRERDRLRAAAESSMDALFICEAVRDPNGEIEDFVFTYLNHNVGKMISVPLDVLLGGKMCELLPVNVELGLFDAYKNVAALANTGAPFVIEFPVQDESIKSGWVRIQAVRFEEGVAITASDRVVHPRLKVEHQPIGKCKVLHTGTHRKRRTCPITCSTG